MVKFSLDDKARIEAARQHLILRLDQQKSLFIQEQLENTKIRKPYTANKLRWHGIKLVEQNGKGVITCWLEQRGEKIGDVMTFNVMREFYKCYEWTKSRSDDVR